MSPRPKPRVDLRAVVEEQVHQACSIWCNRIFKLYGLHERGLAHQLADDVDYGVELVVARLSRVIPYFEGVLPPPEPPDYTPSRKTTKGESREQVLPPLAHTEVELPEDDDESGD